jgi:hypothetical protein
MEVGFRVLALIFRLGKPETKASPYEKRSLPKMGRALPSNRVKNADRAPNELGVLRMRLGACGRELIFRASAGRVEISSSARRRRTQPHRDVSVQLMKPYSLAVRELPSIQIQVEFLPKSRLRIFISSPPVLSFP